MATDVPSVISNALATDDLTILLALISATVFLLRNYYKPQPLVHPILLGRQSDVARVRNPGESATYRNYSTGLMGHFSLRPSKDVHILADLLRNDQDTPRTLWNTKISNPVLQDRVAAFGTGILRLADLSSQESNVLMLLNDCIEFVICDLALAAHSVPSFTLSSATLLAPILDLHPPSAIVTHADLLPQLLELIYDEGQERHHTIIVVGEPSTQALAMVASKVKVLKWADVEREGNRVQKVISPLPKPSDIFTVSFYALETGQLQGVQLTHENITAGTSAVKALLPQSQAFSSLDTVVSAFSMNTPFGRSIAYTAIYEGTSFATVDSVKIYTSDDATPSPDGLGDIISCRKYPIPNPTVLFIKPPHVTAIVQGIVKEAEKSILLYPIAWRHKVASLREGFITKDSLWDRLVFDAARAKVLGEAAGTIRNVIVSGGVYPTSMLTLARIALSTPFVNAYSHPAASGPVLASHALDLQDFSGSLTADPPAPTGPPCINVEAKLVGVTDDVVEAGGDPEGLLMIRGPTIGKILNGEDYVDIPSTSSEEEDGWVGTGVRAAVQTNGAFRVYEKTV